METPVGLESFLVGNADFRKNGVAAGFHHSRIIVKQSLHQMDPGDPDLVLAGISFPPARGPVLDEQTGTVQNSTDGVPFFRFPVEQQHGFADGGGDPDLRPPPVFAGGIGPDPEIQHPAGSFGMRRGEGLHHGQMPVRLPGGPADFLLMVVHPGKGTVLLDLSEQLSGRFRCAGTPADQHAFQVIAKFIHISHAVFSFSGHFPAGNGTVRHLCLQSHCGRQSQNDRT